MIVMTYVYAGEPNTNLENAIDALIEPYNTYEGDSGYGCGERDRSIGFGAIADEQKADVARQVLALGCLSVDWDECAEMDEVYLQPA